MILNDIETAGNADRLLPSNDSAGDVLPLERAETGAPDSAQSPPSSPSPVNLRKRKPMSAGAAFDPSRCPQCGTGSMCSRCKSNLEKEREKSASPRPVPLSVPSKQAKKQVDISRRVAHGSGPLTSHPPARSKEGPAVGPRPAPRALAGAAARSHEKKLIRLQTDQVDGNDLSTSSRMFEFIERFLRECPSCRLDSSVKMQFEEPQMTSSGNLTYRQLAQHVFDLRVEHVQRLVRPVLHRLMAHPRNSDIFNQPVDPVALGIPTYFDKIKNPMDLSTVKGKLQRGAYHTLDECVTEISLVFNNATAFNPPGHVVHDIAKLLNNEFNVELASLKEKLDKEVCLVHLLHYSISALCHVCAAAG